MKIQITSWKIRSETGKCSRRGIKSLSLMLLLINRVMKEPINNGDVVLIWRIKASEEAR